MVELAEAEVIGPTQPIYEVPMSRIVSGLRALQSGQKTGNIVAVMGKEDRVMADVTSPLRRENGDILLRADVTYLITGGTGGIGRSLVPWMLENGASNVALLGRSGASRPVAELVTQYNSPSTGINVRAVVSDVASRSNLSSALDSLQDLSPVRGVIHASMHLHDSIFFNASFDNWRVINGPKIDAAWHLHHLLPDLDFFVALGPVANTFGNVGQSIYAGTSSFLDAFARWRTRQGLPTVSIGLPVVDDVSYVTEREDMHEKLSERMGSLSIKQVHTMIKGASIGASSGLNYDSRAIAFVTASIFDNIQGLKEGARYLSIFRQKKTAAK